MTTEQKCTFLKCDLCLRRLGVWNFSSVVEATKQSDFALGDSNANIGLGSSGGDFADDAMHIDGKSDQKPINPRVRRLPDLDPHRQHQRFCPWIEFGQTKARTSLSVDMMAGKRSPLAAGSEDTTMATAARKAMQGKPGWVVVLNTLGKKKKSEQQ